MDLKIITLNIWFGRLLENAVAFLVQEDADIVFLQEVFDGHNMEPEWLNALTSLKNKLPQYGYRAFFPACLYLTETKTHVPQGQMILSKYPILSNEGISYDIPFGEFNWEDKNRLLLDFQNYTPQDFSKMPRALQHVQIQLNDKKLNIFNTQGIWARHGEDNEQRLAMGEVIIENIKNKELVILAGDFNIKPHTQTIKNITKYVTSVFGEELRTTFNMKRKTNPGFLTAAVDMIFVSEEFTIVRKFCPEVDVSDHLPLVAIVRV